MKKILFLLSIILICSCKAPCLLGQPDSPLIYAKENCTAIIPDFTQGLTVLAGCTGYKLIQTPAAGTVVTGNTPINIRAIGTNGRMSPSSNFVAIFADTITPRLIWPVTNLDTLLKKSNDLYDIADRMTGLIDSLSNTYPGAVYQDVLRTKVFMVTSVLNDEGNRQRTISFHDTLSVPLFSVFHTVSGDSTVIR